MNDQIILIKQEMEKILLSPNGKDGNFRPIKGTTKTQCYNVLGKIQSILETNKCKVI